MPQSFRSRIVSIGLVLLVAGHGSRGAELEDALAENDLSGAELELEQLSSEWKDVVENGGSSEDSLQYGLTLQALGIVERQAGKSAEAVEHLEAAVALLEPAPPGTFADALEALALARQDLGDFTDAEKDLRQVLDLRESLPAAEQEPSRTQTLDHLGLNFLGQGKYPEAGAILSDLAASDSEADPITRARRLGHYARYLHTLGNHARAAEQCRRALSQPFEDPELRLALKSQLAVAELRLGMTTEAREGMESAAEEARLLFKKSATPFRAAPYFNNLGALDLSQGFPEQARSSFVQSLELLEDSLGTDHPALIAPLNNLGCAELAVGDHEAASVHLRRAAALQAEHLPPVHLRVAETARNLARNALLAGDPEANEYVDRATKLGLALLDELIRNGSEQERLNFLQRLDLLSLPCATGDAEMIANVLIASKARLLDAMLTTDSADSREVPDWRQVQAALPDGSAFIDSCRYRSIEPEGGERYGAIVLLPEGRPKWIELGSSDDLDHWLEALRRRLSWVSSNLSGHSSPAPTLTLQGILKALYREFWMPIARELPAEAADLAFSPDGALHFLPLPALLGPDLQPLCTLHRQIATLTSARDLISADNSLSLSDSPWTIVGVSDFPKGSGHLDGDPLLEVLSQLGPMPGTAEEARRIRALAPPGSLVLTDEQATESALSRLGASPAVLHLGCHAFFLFSEPGDSIVLDFDQRADLLYSGGLVLHGGAIRGPDSPLISTEDDLLFPTEVAALPLHGTRLVTLSSCESGAGTAVSGEGLLGLRRGFALAGVREVVVALWPVSDQAAPAFMERFYRLAIASNRPAQALWQTQAEFLGKGPADKGFEAAVLRYAPFVLSQNSPLVSGEKILLPIPKPVSDSRRRLGAYLLLTLPLVIFLAARLLSPKRGR